MLDHHRMRAWDSRAKKYIPDLMSFVISSDGCFDQGWFYHDLIIELCTGLKDINGKLIFEGDRVSIAWLDDSESECEVRYFAEGDYPAFDFHPHQGTESNGFSEAIATGCEIELIGNIHEEEAR